MFHVGIVLFNFLLMFIYGTALIALVFFIISMILFVLSKNEKAKNKEKKNGKRIGAIVTLVISIVFFLPLAISMLAMAIDSKIQDTRKEQMIESIENKVIVKADEWKNGFEYDGKYFVPVNLLMNSDDYTNSGLSQNLNKIGALVEEETNCILSFYELDNDSGYQIYYVWVETFSGGDYYSRTFVDENDYDSVLEYYHTSNLKMRTLWRSAPQDLKASVSWDDRPYKLSNTWQSLNLNMDDHRDEIIELAHEILDDVSNRKRVGTSSKDYDECMEFKISSADKVFTIHLVIYTKGDEMKLYLNDYEIEEKIVQEHKDMLLSMMDDAQKELLEMAKQTP